jgi:hypothetical protein
MSGVEVQDQSPKSKDQSPKTKVQSPKTKSKVQRPKIKANGVWFLWTMVFDFGLSLRGIAGCRVETVTGPDARTSTFGACPGRQCTSGCRGSG